MNVRCLDLHLDWCRAYRARGKEALLSQCSVLAEHAFSACLLYCSILTNTFICGTSQYFELIFNANNALCTQVGYLCTLYEGTVVPPLHIFNFLLPFCILYSLVLISYTRFMLYSIEQYRMLESDYFYKYMDNQRTLKVSKFSHTKQCTCSSEEMSYSSGVLDEMKPELKPVQLPQCLQN